MSSPLSIDSRNAEIAGLFRKECDTAITTAKERFANQMAELLRRQVHPLRMLKLDQLRDAAGRQEGVFVEDIVSQLIERQFNLSRDQYIDLMQHSWFAQIIRDISR
jgi:hypothetical protein